MLFKRSYFYNWWWISGWVTRNTTIIGCSSSGAIGQYGGGISGGNANNVICESCWSTGTIGPGGGGITGDYTTNTTITNCYSIGNIGSDAGGIYGMYSSGSTVEGCYTTGVINASGGGGIGGVNSSGNITNCYTTGNILSGGGIAGANFVGSVSNCYAAGSTSFAGNYIICGINEVPPTCYSEAQHDTSGWNSGNANTVLQGIPLTVVVGDTWVASVLGQPYELKEMGYTPYTVDIINSSPMLVRTFVANVLNGGETTNPAIISGKSYTILEKSAGDPGSYDTITIDSTSGSISTESNTTNGTYSLYIRNTGSYNITEVELTVGPVPCLVEGTTVLTPIGYRSISMLRKGMRVLTSDNRKVKIMNIYKSLFPGNERTWPCIVPKGGIAANYPQEELRISQDHLIRYKNRWILPKQRFPLDTSMEKIQYYHIELENYPTDHLVVNGGTVVESLGITKDLAKQARYGSEYRSRILPYHPHRSFSMKN